jgi:hypothetical protein
MDSLFPFWEMSSVARRTALSRYVGHASQSDTAHGAHST